jgi:pimeloyl-ACP methyl ester carboxylesterase
VPNVTANRIKIHYEERGSGDPLVLIMGLGADGSVWELHAAEYEKHFRCILVDNRGAGRSSRPAGPYTTRMMARDTAGLMDALGIRNARIAGISMGSGIAQELALARPEKVRSLVLVSSWSRCDRYTTALIEHFAAMRAVAKPAAFMKLLQLWIFTPGHYNTHMKDMLTGQRDAKKNYMALHAFRAQCAACLTHNTFARLRKIRAPALLTVGSADVFTPLWMSAEMHERMPDSRMKVFRGRGHCHHWEDLARFNAVTTTFLRAH